MINPVKRERSLRSHAIGMIAALVLQYLLGMFSNLFVAFPDGVHEKAAWDFAENQMPIVLHIILGLLILFGSIALLVRAAIKKEKMWVKSASVSVGAVLGAIITGSMFISKQSDLYSFLMSIFFLIALLSYGWGLYKTK